jgi:cytochrome c oxidase cbb3-type subunit 1
VGIFLYVFGLAIGGVLQGTALNDPTVPFAESVKATLPWLWVRTVAGVLLTAGHFVFIYLVYQLATSRDRELGLPPWQDVTPLVVETGRGAK